MQIELKIRGMFCVLEEPIKVNFKGYLVGDYAADLFVEKKVLVELKVAEKYKLQLCYKIGYLCNKATQL